MVILVVSPLTRLVGVTVVDQVVREKKLRSNVDVVLPSRVRRSLIEAVVGSPRIERR
jgi:hypothetical protein